jgi:hypothetical protein
MSCPYILLSISIVSTKLPVLQVHKFEEINGTLWAKSKGLAVLRTTSATGQIPEALKPHTLTMNLTYFISILSSSLSHTPNRLFQVASPLKSDTNLWPASFAHYSYSIQRPFSRTIHYWMGSPWRSWLRHCATNRKAAGSILDGVVDIFH